MSRILSRGGGGGSTWPGTPPGTSYTPQTKYTPRDQVQPPRTRYTLPGSSACREKRATSGRYTSTGMHSCLLFFLEIEHCLKMVVKCIRDTQVRVFIPQEFNASRCVEVHLLTQYSLNLQQLDWLCTSVDKLREKFIPKILR